MKGDVKTDDLVEHMDEVCIVVDDELKQVHFVNQAYETVWDRSCRSLYDDPASWLTAVVESDRRGLEEYIRRVRAGQIRHQSEYEFRVVRRTRETRWIRARFSFQKAHRGERPRLVVFAKDISELHETRTDLAETTDKYEKAVDASFDGLVVTQDGVILEANRRFVEMFGCSSDFEVVGRSLVRFMAPESAPQVAARERDHTEGTFEAVGLRKDTSRIFLEMTSVSHKVGGRPARITALRNVTERRGLEDQFRQAQKMEAVGRLAGGVAHDFNNLLTVIGINTELLFADMSPRDPRRAELEEVKRATEAATTLTRQLLAFSRQQVIEPRVVKLEDVISQTERLLLRLIGEDISLTTNFRCGPCVVHMDPGQLEQILMNLVVNARDAMPTGGRIAIETDLVELDEAYAAAHWPVAPGNYVLMSVSDTGIGMDATTRARIFEPFFTTKEQGRGTGLGLATVYGIVKQNNGFIWVYSEPGQGAAFKVYLPLYAGPAPVTEEAQATEAVNARGTETVLLIEDSSAVREITRRALESYGYDVIEAPSARASVTLASNLDRPLHLILTDVVMPDISGRIVAERIRRLHPTAKVLFMSGYTDDAVIRHGVLSAQTPFIQKPFTSGQIAARVREVLNKPH